MICHIASYSFFLVRRSVVNPTDIDCNYNQCKTNLRTDDNRSVYGEQVGNGKRYFSNKCELCAQSCVEMKAAGTQRNSSNKIYILGLSNVSFFLHFDNK